MAVGSRRAGLLLAVLALALAALCAAEQDNREAHIQLQSAAKVNTHPHFAFAASAGPADAGSSGKLGESHFEPCSHMRDEMLRRGPAWVADACRHPHACTVQPRAWAWCLAACTGNRSRAWSRSKGSATVAHCVMRGCSWTRAAPSATGCRALSGRTRTTSR